MRVLLLGGTTEARGLAARLADSGRFEIETSLVGATARPLVPGLLRVGPFGGAEGLADYLRTGSFGAVIDATHPFATAISANAVEAAEAARLPLLTLVRPGWTEQPGDDWRRMPDFAAAAAAVRALAAPTVFLAIGRGELAWFADNDTQHFVLRMIDAPRPDDVLPARRTVLLARGPFDLDAERDLFTRHDVGVLVTKDSGGVGAVAKLVAARELGRPVVVIDRPQRTGEAEVVDSVDAALSWLVSLSQ